MSGIMIISEMPERLIPMLKNCAASWGAREIISRPSGAWAISSRWKYEIFHYQKNYNDYDQHSGRNRATVLVY